MNTPPRPSHRAATAAVFALLGLAASATAADAASFRQPWPEAAAIDGRSVAVDSHSPFVPADIDDDPPATPADVTWFAPRNVGAARRAPAVVLLHGAGGVQGARETTYARQLAAMGIGAAVVDVFAARRDRARSFTERIIEITETMALADAYATLGWLKARPEIDADRVAVWGFSYGAMASVFAANAGVAERFAEKYRLGPTRFAGHVAFYGPCITSFEDNRTTGAPVLLAWGDRDALIDAERCGRLADDLRAGGSEVRTEVFAGAFHQWDGGWPGPRSIGRLLHGCDFRVGRDLTVNAGALGIPMFDTFTRKLILAWCVGSDGYLIGRDDAIRARSNRLVAAFLTSVFRLDPGG